MARNERRVFGFMVAIVILALAVGLLGWSNREQGRDRARLRGQVSSNSARVGQLEGQLREHGIEPAPPTTTTSTTAVVRRSQPRTTRATAAHVPPTSAAPAPSTTSTTAKPATPPPPPPTTSTTTVTCQTLPSPIGRCLP